MTSDDVDVFDAPANLVDSTPLPSRLLDEAVWSPMAYTGLLHFLLDGGMTGLSAPAQVVYLHLVREAFGRRRNPVAMTLDRLRARTGLSRSTIHQALQRLTHPDVDIVNVVHPGGGKRAGLYEIRPCSYQAAEGKNITGRRSRRRAKSTNALDSRSIENLLAHLSVEDRADLQIVYDSLQGHERRAIEQEVRDRFHDIGQNPDKTTFQQGLLFYLLKQRMFGRLRSKYPTLSTPAQ